MMRRGMSNTFQLKLRRYSDRMIKFNEYFDVLPEAKASDRIGDTGLNEIILNSMKNGWSKQ